MIKQKLPRTIQELEEKRSIGRKWYRGILLPATDPKRIYSKSSIVRVSNKLIEAGHNRSISKTATILLFYALTRIDLNDKKLFVFDLDLNNFSKLLPGKRTALSTEINKTLYELSDLKLIFDDENERTLIQFFPFIRYKKHERIINLKFNEDLKPFLIQLKGYFTSFNINHCIDLQGKYSWWLYIRLISEFWRTKTPQLLLKDLYSMWGINHNTIFSNFKLHLDKAVEQINTSPKTTITCTYELFKEGQGQKVTRIDFEIRKKPRAKKKLKKIDYHSELTKKEIKNLEEQQDLRPELTEVIRKFFEKRYGKVNDWENMYPKGSVAVYDIWEKHYKGKKEMTAISLHPDQKHDYGKGQLDDYVARTPLIFLNRFVIPWLKTMYRNRKGKITPTWLLSKEIFKSNIKTFVKEFDKNVDYSHPDYNCKYEK